MKFNIELLISAFELFPLFSYFCSTILLMRYLFFLALLFSNLYASQVVNKTDSNRVKPADTLVIDSGTRDSLKIFKPTIQDYKSFKQFSEKQVIDTVLSGEKTYVFTQWNNRDNFGRIQFANIGAGFNPLVYELNPEQNLTLLPENKSFGFLGIKDIRYYDVKTPTTTFIYHNAMRNGAALNSTYTQNIGNNFNFALEYMGLRSQGIYNNSLAANNNTVFSGHYISDNLKYEAFAHFIHQNVNNQEYGGIVNEELFRSDADAYDNRANVEINLQGVTSQFSARRYYFSHQFAPFDPVKYPFKIRHTIYHQGNKYRFSQDALQDFFYDTPSGLVPGFSLSTGKFSNNLSNTVSLVLDNERFRIDAGVRHQLMTLGVTEPLNLADLSVPSEIRENRIGAVGNLGVDLWDRIALNSFLEVSRGEQFGNYLQSRNQFRFEPVEGYFVNAKVNFQSAAPSFNYHLNTSPYKAYNFYAGDLKNQNVLEIGGNVNLKWFETQVFANYFRINNYTYFRAAVPQQSDTPLNISQIGGDATFRYGKFGLNSRLLFQKTLTNSDLFPAPDFVGRVNLFFQSKAFKNAAEIQTGVKGHFFTKFGSREYSPILNEFTVPGPQGYQIGGIPVIDAYFNLKVKRMFFFIEGQHLNTLIDNNKIFTAPYYPFYDFRLNIGIVWYLIS